MKAFVLVFMTLFAAVAVAKPDDGAEDFDRGMREYTLQNYGAAIEAFESAYRKDPKPLYLYPLAQAQRLNGDCVKAIVTYKSFIRLYPQKADKALEAIARCEADLAKTPEPVQPQVQTQTQPPPPVVIAPPPPPLSPRIKHARPWYKDAVGDALTISGVVALGVGAGLFAAGKIAANDANGATNDKTFIANRGAYGEQVGGVVCLAAGGALVVGGITEYLVRAHHAHATHALAPMISPSVVGVAIGGAF